MKILTKAAALVATKAAVFGKGVHFLDWKRLGKEEG
jgi:hypothetical protein